MFKILKSLIVPFSEIFFEMNTLMAARGGTDALTTSNCRKSCILNRSLSLQRGTNFVGHTDWPSLCFDIYILLVTHNTKKFSKHFRMIPDRKFQFLSYSNNFRKLREVYFSPDVLIYLVLSIGSLGLFNLTPSSDLSVCATIPIVSRHD